MPTGLQEKVQSMPTLPLCKDDETRSCCMQSSVERKVTREMVGIDVRAWELLCQVKEYMRRTFVKDGMSGVGGV
jgi:hypothetical protein